MTHLKLILVKLFFYFIYIIKCSKYLFVLESVLFDGFVFKKFLEK